VGRGRRRDDRGSGWDVGGYVALGGGRGDWKGGRGE